MSITLKNSGLAWTADAAKCHNLGFPYVTQRNDSIPFNELNITYYKKGSNHMWKKSIIDVIHVHQYIKEKNDPNDTELRESLH